MEKSGHRIIPQRICAKVKYVEVVVRKSVNRTERLQSCTEEERRFLYCKNSRVKMKTWGAPVG